ERALGVRLERRALLSCVLEGKLVAALAETQEEREQRGAGQHVGADRGAGGDAAGDDAEHEAERDEADVEERDLLELEAVGEVLDEVDERDGGEGPAELDVTEAERERDEERREGLRHALRHGAA